MKLLKEYIASTSLKQKFTIIISVSVIVCVLISCTFSFLIFNKYNKLLYKNTSYILQMSIINIENDLKNIEKITESIIGDENIQSGLPVLKTKEMKISYSESISKVYGTLKSYKTDDNIISMAIHTSDRKINVGWNYVDDKQEIIKKAITLAKKAGGKTVWLSSGRSDSSIICARDIRQVKNLELNSLGVLIVHVDLKDIVANRLQHYNKLNYKPCISISSDQEILYSSIDLNNTYKKINDDNYNSYYTEKIGNQEYFITGAKKSFPWQYTMYIPFDSITGSIKTLRIILIMVMVAVVFVAFYLSVKVISQIIKHFDILVNKMQTFKKGNFNINYRYDYSKRNDELGYLHRSFDEMVTDIKQLVDDNYVKQLLIKDAQIKSLQQQINPHFLFNILQTVNWMAKTNNQTEISIIIESVGKLLRYSLSEQNNVVELKKELENTQSYIYIQKIRYKERLVVNIQVSETLNNEKIPKMALQALVENAINHALENMIGVCYIKISTQEDKNSFNLIVEDNGPGIPEDILEKLKNKQMKPSGLGIGLLNIHQRIQLLFSDEYGIKLENTGHGTKVLIKLPKG